MTVARDRTPPRLRPTVATVIALDAAVALALVGPQAGAWSRPPHLLALLALCAAFAAVGRLNVELEFSRHRAWFTLTESVLVIALFHLPAPWIALAVGAGEAARCLTSRAPALKASFNAVSQTATAAAAGQVFHLLRPASGAPGGSWLAALGAVGCWGILNAASVSAILARAENRGFGHTLTRSVPTAAATTVVGTALGLLVQQLWSQGPGYPLLIGPIAVVVWMNSRHAAIHRSEHLRFERLYQATTRTAERAAERAVTAVVAEEARGLLTGEASLCLMGSGPSGWEGHSVGTDRSGTADPDQVEALLSYQLEPGQSLSTPALHPALRRLAAGSATVVIARSPTGSDCDLLVAVMRSSTGTPRDSSIADSLAAYVAHGAAIAANAILVGRLHRSLRAQMIANQRKDEFVSTISHELRTPLTVVIGAVETLQRLDDRIQPAARDRLLHNAADQGQRLRLLIEDLLLVAAAEQGRIHCDVVASSAAELADDVLADLPDMVRPAVRLRRPEPGAVVTTDRFKARQIIANLVQNAAKYAPGSPVEVGFECRGAQLCVSVSDHGPGIAEADRDRVFERFVQLDQSATRSSGGSGLGLFICRQLADRMGATLDLAETPGGGCTFTLGLPLADPGREALPGGAEAAPRPAAGLLARPDTFPGADPAAVPAVVPSAA